LVNIKVVREDLLQPVEQNTIGLPARTSRLHSPEVVHARDLSVHVSEG